jgi:hypothetical protein
VAADDFLWQMRLRGSKLTWTRGRTRETARLR